MKTPSLEEEATEFLNVMTIVERFEGRAKMFPELQRLFAMRAAYWIRQDASSCMAVGVQSFGESLPNSAESLSFAVMYEAYRRLLAAYRSSDNFALASALREMKILEFCPALEDQFARMEQLTQQVEAHVRMILHVELALFAFELGAEGAVRHHAMEAWALNPISWERYILCTLQGYYEGCSGNIHGATHWLEDSISACYEDERILIECGVRPPNLHLAQKLLSLGQRIPVVDYLLACQDVWRSKGMPFVEWVHQIELGQVPEFEASETIRELSRPFRRLDLQSLHAYIPWAERLSSSSPHAKRSRREVLLARDKRLTECEQILRKIRQERTPNPGESGREPQT